MAKERALRRQTLSGGDADAARVATAEAAAAREGRARRDADARLVAAEHELQRVRGTVEEMRDQITAAQVLYFFFTFFCFF